jgi:hypothetical protein
MKTSVAFMPLLLLTAGFCFASDIIYDVYQTVGARNVTGFIETNGTIGVLDAEYLLEGSVFRAGPQLRINTQLIRVRDPGCWQDQR